MNVFIEGGLDFVSEYQKFYLVQPIDETPSVRYDRQRIKESEEMYVKHCKNGEFSELNS